MAILQNSIGNNLPLPDFGSGININQIRKQQNNAMTAMSVAPFAFEEVSVDRDNVLTMEGNYDKPVQANEIITVFKALVENQDDIKCMAKINLEQKPLYEIIFKDYATKASVKAMIGDELKLKDQILKCSENRDVKDTRKTRIQGRFL